jgi:DNA-binding transcriptional regulator YiaG
MTTDLDALRARIINHGARRRKAQATVNARSRDLASLARAHVGRDMVAADFARLAGVPKSTVKRWVESG